jgi:alpha-maltose-1-phosphate synthase
MKVAFLTPEFPHPKIGSSGGIGTSIFNLSKGLKELGHQVSIVVYGQDRDEVFEENDIIFYKIKNIKLKGLSLILTQKKIQKLIDKLYSENKIEILEAPDWTGITSFIKPKKCPIVIRLNGSDTYFCHLDNRPVKFLNKFLEKRALKNANAHLSVSKFTAKVTNELFGLNINFTIIPNSINSEDFKNENLINKEKLIILYFGTLIRKKGLLELPFIFNEVHKIIPNAQLYLVGKDSPDIMTSSSSTWSLMKNLFDTNVFKNVHYIKGVPHAQIKEHIINATLCVFPTFAEALPVSWLEAMAMKKGIVASNIGWATEMIQDGLNGYLVNPKKHQEYANRIVSLLEDKNLVEKFGSEALKTIQNKFEVNKIAIQNLDFYQNVISTIK